MNKLFAFIGRFTRPFTANEQKGFNLMVKHEAWLNTALLAGLLYNAFFSHNELKFMLSVFLLFLTWSLYRMQKRELNNNVRWLFPVFSVVQTAIVVFAILVIVADVLHHPFI